MDAQTDVNPDTGQDAIDESLMRLALVEAEQAAADGEVPIGAVVVYEGRVIGSGRNRREHWADPTAHAEIVALRRAGALLGGWRLTDCTLYATIEPCAMCAGAAVVSRLARVVYGAPDPKFGGLGSVLDVSAHERFNHRFAVRSGVLAAECAALMRRFFSERRERRDTTP